MQLTMYGICPFLSCTLVLQYATLWPADLRHRLAWRQEASGRPQRSAFRVCVVAGHALSLSVCLFTADCVSVVTVAVPRAADRLQRRGCL